MVRLTIDFIKNISSKPYSSPEKTEDSLKKITHLNLSEKLIDSIVKYDKLIRYTYRPTIHFHPIFYLKHTNRHIVSLFCMQIYNILLNVNLILRWF